MLDPISTEVLLFAAILHASWHALVKGGNGPLVNFCGMGLIAAVPAAAVIPLVPLPPQDVTPILGVSILLHGAYKVCVAFAYANADLARAFPLARGWVPLFATALASAWLGQTPSTHQTAAILLSAAGILCLAAERNSVYIRVLLAAMLAGFAIAGYSVLDAYGTRLYGNWAGFTAWLVLSDSIEFAMLARMIRGRGIWASLVRVRARVLSSGVLGVIAFSAFLWALSRNPTGPVTALRETSILFAMLFGAILNKEALDLRRIVSGAAILAGIALMTL